MILPRIVISTGEPAGIGPDIMLMCANMNRDESLAADVITIGDPELFARRAQQLGLDITIQTCTLESPREITPAGTLKVFPVELNAACEPGQLNPDNGRYVLNVLDAGIQACLNQQADALVTGPIQKSVLNHLVDHFSGHTEYLAEKTEAKLPVMMLATEGLRVALVTTHMALSEVPAHITKESVQETLSILDHDLKHYFGIKNPQIVVAGLNPHAGEDGSFGREDMDIIQPVLKAAKEKGMNVTGPLPADTLFTPKYLDTADAVLAMYHDQGLPVLKFKGFGNAINITLGLPILRTSVDHGTALELAGTGLANANSMMLAINTALEICQGKNA